MLTGSGLSLPLTEAFQRARAGFAKLLVQVVKNLPANAGDIRDLLGWSCCHPGCPAPGPILGGELEGCSGLTKGSWWSLQKDPLENFKLGNSLTPEKSEQPVDWI